MSSQQDLRLHDRITSEFLQHIHITYLGQPIGLLKDLSYGGALIHVQLAEFAAIADKQEVKIEMHAPWNKVELMVTKIHTRQSESGLAFQHNTLASLIFLRDILEYQKIGHSVRKIESSQNNHSTDIHLIGSSELNMIFKKQTHTHYTDTFLSFNSEGQLVEVNILTPHQVKTGKVGGRLPLPGNIRDIDATLNPQVLRQTFAILKGAKATLPNISEVSDACLAIEKLLD